MFFRTFNWEEDLFGHEKGGMYYLDDRVSPTSLVAGQHDPILLWHWCLGHPSVQKFQFVVLVESSISSLGFASCELGKHHCATYQSRVNNCSNSAFELVHSDVCGLCRVPSAKDFRYFSYFC